MNNVPFFVLDIPYISDLNANRQGYGGSFDQNTPIAYFDYSLRAFQQSQQRPDIIEVIENPPYSNPSVQNDDLIIDLETGQARPVYPGDILRDGGSIGVGKDKPPMALTDITKFLDLKEYGLRGVILLFASLLILIAIYRMIK